MNPPQLLRASLTICGLALSAAVLTSGCASSPPEPHTMRDPQANFSAFKTFGWAEEQNSQATGQPVTIVDSTIRAAITDELQRKGYEEAASGTKPDLVLNYETGKAEKLKSSPFRIGVGVGGYGSSGGAGVGASSSGVKNVIEGALTLRVIDPARNAEVWNGNVSRELGKGNVDPALVNSAVAELLRDFPARAGAPPQ
ncbi:MAG TPA: DUF4136 domain-containing protein [Steroidobacteraceae bacterium]|nr:DUF4136 domain-containing protein [Steroidobacteraceae bacterium]